MTLLAFGYFEIARNIFGGVQKKCRQTQRKVNKHGKVYFFILLFLSVSQGSNMSQIDGKRKRIVLTLEDKLAVIQERETGEILFCLQQKIKILNLICFQDFPSIKSQRCSTLEHQQFQKSARSELKSSRQS